VPVSPNVRPTDIEKASVKDAREAFLMSLKSFPQSEGDQKIEGGAGDQITISSVIRSSNVNLFPNSRTINLRRT
jgi:hypothetical protein